MTKFGKICCKNETFHQIFHNLNDFYHIILLVMLLFFGIICFLAAKLQFFSYCHYHSRLHSLFPEKSSFSGGSRHTRIRRKRSFRTLLKTHLLRTVRKLRKPVVERFPLKAVFSF